MFEVYATMVISGIWDLAIIEAPTIPFWSSLELPTEDGTHQVFLSKQRERDGSMLAFWTEIRAKSGKLGLYLDRRMYLC